MLRQLLTLIAIVTGLAAIGAPAQARASALADVSQQAISGPSASCRAESQRMSERRSEPVPVNPADGDHPCPYVRLKVRVPTLMLGADRALE